MVSCAETVMTFVAGLERDVGDRPERRPRAVPLPPRSFDQVTDWIVPSASDALPPSVMNGTVEVVAGADVGDAIGDRRQHTERVDDVDDLDGDVRDAPDSADRNGAGPHVDHVVVDVEVQRVLVGRPAVEDEQPPSRRRPRRCRPLRPGRGSHARELVQRLADQTTVSCPSASSASTRSTPTRSRDTGIEPLT